MLFPNNIFKCDKLQWDVSLVASEVGLLVERNPSHTDLRSRFGKCFSCKGNLTDHNKNYGNPSYRYYRRWFTDYKGPEPEGLCINLKKNSSNIKTLPLSNLAWPLTPGNQNSSPKIESKIESIIESRVQSMVQSRVQSPGFVLSHFRHSKSVNHWKSKCVLARKVKNMR